MSLPDITRKLRFFLFVCLFLFASFSCKQRDTAAEPIFDLAPDREISPAHISNEQTRAENKEKTYPDKKQPDKAPSSIATDPLSIVRPFTEKRLIQSAFVSFLRIGKIELAKTETTPGRTGNASDPSEHPSRFSPGISIPQSGLNLWKIAEQNNPEKQAFPPLPLKREPVRLGEMLHLVAYRGQKPVIIEVRVASEASFPLNNEQTPLGPDRFLLLDHAPLADLLPGWLVDLNGKIAGLAIPQTQFGLLAALSTSELKQMEQEPEKLISQYQNTSKIHVNIPPISEPVLKEVPVQEIPPVDPPVISEIQIEKPTDNPPDATEKTQPEAPALKIDNEQKKNSTHKQASGRLYLGLQVQTVSKDLLTSFNLPVNQNGVLVSAVHPHSPASKSGILQGDLIVALADQPIHQLADFPPILKRLALGQSTALSIIRQGVATRVSLTPSPR